MSAPPPRTPSATLRPHVTLSLLYLAFFFLAYSLLLVAPELSEVVRPASPEDEQAIKQAAQHLAEAQSRAGDAGYRLILADLHVARARLAKLAGDHEQMHQHCSEALAICDAPDCGYAWPKQDAQPLLAP